MHRRGIVIWTVAAVAAVVILMPARASAQAGNVVGTFKLMKDVTANGEPLEPGTYTVRLVDLPIKPVVGQNPAESHWVEFVQGEKVRGKEIATVLLPGTPNGVMKAAPPAPGQSRVQLLRGGDYVRVWLNKGGTQYLIHLPVAAAPAAAKK
jgi:hypothetical protein